MGVSWLAIEEYYLDDSLLADKYEQTQKRFMANRGLSLEEKSARGRK